MDDLFLISEKAYNNPNTLIDIAILSIYNKEFEEAEKFLNLAKNIDNNNAYALYWLGHLYLRKKNINKALELYKKSYNLDKNKYTLNAICIIYLGNFGQINNVCKAFEYYLENRNFNIKEYEQFKEKYKLYQSDKNNIINIIGEQNLFKKISTYIRKNK